MYSFQLITHKYDSIPGAIFIHPLILPLSIFFFQTILLNSLPRFSTNIHKLSSNSLHKTKSSAHSKQGSHYSLSLSLYIILDLPLFLTTINTCKLVNTFGIKEFILYTRTSFHTQKISPSYLIFTCNFKGTC